MSDPNSTVPVSAAEMEQSKEVEPILRLLDRPVTAAELDARAALVAMPGESRSKQSLRLLLFRVGQETAALPAKMLRRVTPSARAVPIPHRTNGIFRGVCNINGELVLCADLHRLLSLADREGAPADAATDSRRMVLLGPADNSWAFEVDALMGVENIDPSTFRVPPLTVEYSIGDFTVGVTDIGGRSVTILNGERILAGFKSGLA